jgi:galactokinase
MASDLAWSATVDKVRVVRAPGRVNLIGEHTDYNDGLVLPAAIDAGISIALVPTADRLVRLRRADTAEEVAIDLDAPGERDGSWRDYVAGTAWALLEAGARVGGFRGLLASDLPMGAGLSSSAALELATALALGGGSPPIDDPMLLAETARRAENEFVGVPCGLMDQFAVTCGRAGHALLLDCRSLEHEAIPLPASVALLICDSGVARRLATSAYEARRDECRRAVTLLVAAGVVAASLRDVDISTLEDHRAALDSVAFRRARHVVTENARVRATVSALRIGDLDSLGKLFGASHASLRDDFEVSTADLDRLVEVAVAAPGAIGARLTGAGLGGAVLALVAVESADAAIEHIRAAYRTPSGSPTSVRRVHAADGARQVWPPS